MDNHRDVPSVIYRVSADRRHDERYRQSAYLPELTYIERIAGADSEALSFARTNTSVYDGVISEN